MWITNLHTDVGGGKLEQPLDDARGVVCQGQLLVVPLHPQQAVQLFGLCSTLLHRTLLPATKHNVFQSTPLT